ncbi:MAG: HU family DNA-binding protein [Bacteroidales bacterium]
MTKADIVNEVAKATGVEKVAVQKAVECFMEVVKNAMAKDQNVYLRGFGSFLVKRRAQKTARNISKNTAIVIPEHCIPSFKPAKTFLNKVKTGVKL